MIRALDTETELIEPGRLVPRLVVVSTAEEGKPPELHHQSSVSSAVLGSDEDTLVGHNMAYDMAVLVDHNPQEFLDPVFRAYEKGRVRDTLIREMLIKIRMGSLKSERGGLSLSDLSELYLGRALKKGEDTWRLRYGELREVPIERWPEDAKAYALLDAETTRRVYLRQTHMPDEVLQVRGAFALHVISAWGFRVDGKALDKLEAELEADVAKASASLLREGLLRQNGSKNMAKLGELVEEAMKGRPIERTKTGKIKTSADIIDSIIESSDNPLLKDYAALQESQKLLTTYVPALREGVERPINTRYQLLMETGRTSSSKPNVQNLPRRPGVRECIVPRPGNVFVACDWTAAELVALAQVCWSKFGVSKMRDAINENIDLHLWLGCRLLGIGYEEAVRRKKDPDVKNARQLAKIANFGFPGGLGATAFISFAAGYGVKIDLEKATTIKAEWISTWSEMVPYFQHIADLTSDFGPKVLVQFKSGRVRGGVSYCPAANSYFQGLVADAAKDALWEVVKASYWLKDSPLYGFRPTFFVHDEIIGEAPEDRAPEMALELQRIMVEVLSRWTPDVRTSATAHLMRRWSKAAEEAYDVNGRLIPWEDREGVK